MQVDSCRGFTLLEVLVALSITAFVATVAYTSLSSVLSGVESTRSAATRTYEINRAWRIISRDLQQFVARPVRDEFGQPEAAMSGGQGARFLLSFTRSGWHNSNDHLRSELQRVNYQFEDESLWRESYPVLDRASDTEPQRVRLLDRVDDVELAFLDSLSNVAMGRDGNSLDTDNWAEDWGSTAVEEADGALPVVLEIRLQLEDWGSIRRLYELPTP